jgi:hypothetical protein
MCPGRRKPPLPLSKWLLALPHYIVLAFRWLAAVVAVLTGDRVHRPIPARRVRLRRRVARWHARVVGYAALLVTDRYPPFSLR